MDSRAALAPAVYAARLAVAPHPIVARAADAIVVDAGTIDAVAHIGAKVTTVVPVIVAQGLGIDAIALVSGEMPGRAVYRLAAHGVGPRAVAVHAHAAALAPDRTARGSPGEQGRGVSSPHHWPRIVQIENRIAKSGGRTRITADHRLGP